MNKKIYLNSIIKILNADKIEIKGKKKNFFSKFCAIDDADKDSICFCKYKDEKGERLLKETKAAIAFCPFGVKLPERKDITYVLVDNPRLAFAKILSQNYKLPQKFEIHKTAIIGKNCKIGKVSVGPYTVIGNNVKIGDGTVIFANVVIADNTTIGRNGFIKSNTTIGQRGFGFEFDRDGIPVSIPHVGAVAIGDNVEIGANNTIVQGKLNNTVIGDYVKTDDHVHVAHNVFIGKRTMITACSEISGSVVIGEDCWLGPNCSIMNKAVIGNKALIGLGAVVIGSLPDNAVAAGNPARIIRIKEKNESPWKGISR